jgi:hypothetical protein
LAITFGHNKDHRPDLKQLLFILTVSEDGGVPLHYRLVWYHSRRKAELDAVARSGRIERALKQLAALREKLRSPRTRYRQEAKVAEAAAQILQSCGAEAWIVTEIQPHSVETFHQDRRGRPGKDTAATTFFSTRWMAASCPNFAEGVDWASEDCTLALDWAGALCWSGIGIDLLTTEDAAMVLVDPRSGKPLGEMPQWAIWGCVVMLVVGCLSVLVSWFVFKDISQEKLIFHMVATVLIPIGGMGLGVAYTELKRKALLRRIEALEGQLRSHGKETP